MEKKAQQYIQDNQLSYIELPFQLHEIPKKTLQINNYQEKTNIILYVHFQHSSFLQKNCNMINIQLEELLQIITTSKQRNCFKYLDIRNYENYETDNNPITSIQSDYQALLILLYFLSMNNQLYSLDISWTSPLPFLDINEVMNLIASFDNLKSLVFKMPCSLIIMPDEQKLLRSFSSKIFCQSYLTTLHFTFNFLGKNNINREEFLQFLSGLRNLQLLQTISLNVLNKAYSDITIDALIALSIHPSLKSITILAEKPLADDNNDALKNKNISEQYLNQLKSSQLEQIHLHSLKTYDFNLFFAILTRLPSLKKISFYSNFSTSIDSLRHPIIPYHQRSNATFPVLAEVDITIFSRLNEEFAQELINGLSQFKTYKVKWYLGSNQNINISDLGLEKTLITMSLGQIIYESKIEQTPSADLLEDYLLFRNSVRLQICAFKKIMWRFMVINPLHIILDLHMD